MPLTAADQKRVEAAEAEAAAAGDSKLVVRVPPESQKLGAFTVVCLILNRTIGSGIYVTPALVLRATNSVGVSLFLWVIGAIFGICGVLVWLEYGLSIPKFRPERDPLDAEVEGEGSLESVPRNGGEKNFLEYVYNHPRFQTTCMYGLVFVILGNLSGNAIAFGIYVMTAADLENNSTAVRLLAVAALTFSCLLHGTWRKGGIWTNNFFAIFKILTLLSIIGIGFALGAGASVGAGPIGKIATANNFDTNQSFTDASKSLPDYSCSILFIVYSFSGFKQPFYMLSEVSQSKKSFAWTTIGTMIGIGLVFILANVAYLCAIPKADILASDFDMATVFFSKAFGNETAPRVMAGIIAFSIFGNILVMTFTACRVKQEIAKEGVLPFSLFFAKSTTTPYARMKARFFPSTMSNDDAGEEELPDQAPIAALLLHWSFSVILVAATSSRPPVVAYTILVELYVYTLVLMVGFAVCAGLLYLRFWNSKAPESWTSTLGFHTWGGPLSAIIYGTICAYLLITLFLTRSPDSPFSRNRDGVPSYVIPTIGLGTLVLGYLYYMGFAMLVPRLKKQVLVVDREPIIVKKLDKEGKDMGEWVQKMEIVEFWWAARGPNGV